MVPAAATRRRWGLHPQPLLGVVIVAAFHKSFTSKIFMSPINFQSRRATVTHLMRCWLEVIKCLVVIEGKTGEGGPWRPYAFDLDVANGEYSNRHFSKEVSAAVRHFHDAMLRFDIHTGAPTNHPFQNAVKTLCRLIMPPSTPPSSESPPSSSTLPHATLPPPPRTPVHYNRTGVEMASETEEEDDVDSESEVVGDLPYLYFGHART